MTPKEAKVWQYLLNDRSATPAQAAEACNVEESFVQALIDRISSNNWREPVPQSTRESILRTAKALTCGDRNKSYGPPYDNLSDCAALWEAYINSKWGCIVQNGDSYAVRITAEDVAWLMSLVKMTRSFYPGYHNDNYVDAAAYAAIAGECREIQEAGG
jgi:hypothetical protein